MVVEGRHHDVAHAFVEGILLDRRAMRVCCQVFDDQDLPPLDGLFVDRANKVLDAILRRIGPDSTVFDVGIVGQHEDAVTLERR